MKDAPPVAVFSSSAPTAAGDAKSTASPLALACCLALAPATAIGFGRFAYALVLPAMRTDLHLTYQQAGALNTANMMGYLLGALLSTRVPKTASPRNTLLIGLAASVAALLLAGVVHSYAAMLFCRALVGMAAAFTFIASTSLAAHLGRNDNESALALGLAIGGPGVGSIIAGLAVPFLVNSPAHWPQAWRFLGGVGVLAWIAVYFGTRSLERVIAANHETQPAPQTPEDEAELPPVPSSASANAGFGALLPTFIAYFLFGLGYIAYMTFLVAFVQGQGAPAAIVAIVWSTLGASMVASAFAWRRALAGESSGRTMALMGVGGALAASLPLISPSLPSLLVSAALFGITTMPIFTAVTLLIRRFLPPGVWANAIAVGTVIFAVGQSLGPIGSGRLSDAFGPRASILWSLVILLVAAGVAWTQKPPSEK